MEKQLTDLDGKIKALNFRVKKTDEILQKDDRVALERQKTDEKYIYVVLDKHVTIIISHKNASKGLLCVRSVRGSPP